VNLSSSSYIADLGKSHESLNDVRTIKCTRRVLASRVSGIRIWVNSSGISITADRDESISMSELEGLDFVVKSRIPIHDRKEE